MILPCIPGGAGLFDLARVLTFWVVCFSFDFVACNCSSSLADSVAESVKLQVISIIKDLCIKIV